MAFQTYWLPWLLFFNVKNRNIRCCWNHLDNSYYQQIHIFVQNRQQLHTYSIGGYRIPTPITYNNIDRVSVLFWPRNKITRLIAITSWCTQPGPNNPWFIEWFLKPFIIGGCLRDMAIMEKVLEETNPADINYTIVRPPGLSFGKSWCCVRFSCLHWKYPWNLMLLVSY